MAAPVTRLTQRIAVLYGVTLVAAVTGIGYALGGGVAAIIGAIVSAAIASANIARSPRLASRWFGGGN
jgi:hypothetical protein